MVDLTYTPSIQPEPLPGRPMPRLPEYVPPGAFGGEIGRGVESVAGAVQEHVDAAMQQARQNQLTDAHNQLQQLSMQLTHDTQNGAFTKQGKDAFGLRGQYLPQYLEGAAKIVSAVPDPKARAAAQLAADQVRNQLGEQLDAHEIEQHRQFGVNTAKASVSLAQQAASANYNHPDIIATNLDHVQASLEDLGRQQGWSPEQLEEATHQARLQLHQGVLTSMLADKQTGMARAYLDSFKGEMKPDEVRLASQAIEGGEVKAASDRILAAYQTDTPTGAQQLLALDKSGLTSEQQSEVIRQVEQRRAELRVQRRQDPRVMNALSALQDHIADGTAGAADLAQADTLWRRGALSDDERLSVHRQVSRAQAQATSDAQLMAPVQAALQAGTPLDPSDSDNREGLDLVFQHASKGMQPGTSEYANLAVDLAHHTGIVPSSAVSWGRANLSDLQNADPKTALAAASLISRLGEKDTRGIDTQTRAIAGQIYEAAQAGTEPAQALRMAQHNATLPEPQRKLLDEQWRTISNPDIAQKKGIVPQNTALYTALSRDKDFTGGARMPPIDIRLQGDFDALTQDYYRYNGGDLAGARKLAVQDLKHTWGVTQVNGKPQVMPYAPERMYPGLTPEMIQEDLAANKLKGAQLVYVPGMTNTTGGQMWHLVMPDKDGNLTPVLDAEHKPQGYQLPLEKLQEKAQRDREAAEQAGQEALFHAKYRRELQQEYLEQLATNPEPF